MIHEARNVNIARLRTSHRTLIENDVDLIDSHDKEKKIVPGDIVP